MSIASSTSGWVTGRSTDPSGKFVGESHITSLHKGCVLFESWTGNGGFTGSCLNLYDAERKQWHQTWVDVSGGILLLDGHYSRVK